MNKKRFVGLLVVAGMITSCSQVAEKAKDEAQKTISQTSESVQKVVNHLGLVYVEQSVQTVTTYDEVNAAR